MNMQDRQRIRTEILKLMTPPVSFRIKNIKLSFHTLYLVTGFCLLFTGIQIGALSTELRLTSYEQQENSLIRPVGQPIYSIDGKAIPSRRNYPELPDIKLIYMES